MKFTFTHQIQFKSGNSTLPFRSTSWWKTERGALRAAERHAEGMQTYYTADSIATHALTVFDDQGRFVTNEAA